MIESSSEDFERVVSPKADIFAKFESKLRPRALSEYVGQPIIKENLMISLEAAKLRKEPLDHILLHGPPGLGKTTLAHIIAEESAVDLKMTSGPALEKQGDLASILSNLQENDILFIDEIHRLKPVVEEVLYTAMEDFGIDIVIGKGPSARNMRINLPRFTLVGATTKLSALSSPLRDRFGNVFKLQFYSTDQISDILLRSASILGAEISPTVASDLAASCRQTPRVANRLLKRVRDFADVRNNSVIDSFVLEATLNALGVDELGLDGVDREILLTIVEKFGGGPVGLNTISAAIKEEQDTIENIYEPFLIQLGFLDRTARGRIVTERAYKHLGIELKV